jgi:hypothetical protein
MSTNDLKKLGCSLFWILCCGIYCSCGVTFYKYYPQHESETRMIYQSCQQGQCCVDTLKFVQLRRKLHYKDKQSSYCDTCSTFFLVEPHKRQDVASSFEDFGFAHYPYSYRFGKLYITDYLSINENLGGIPSYSVLFPRKVKLKDEYIFRSADVISVFRIMGFENVSIGGQDHHCLKLVSQNNYSSDHIDTIWFQKGKGIIKWAKNK